MKSKEQIVELNKQQADFYNAGPKGEHKNYFSRVWSGVRNGPLNVFMKKYGIKERYYSVHREWMGDLKGKKVLDLGCLRGNYLSLYIAKHAEEYIGIDLSEVAITDLNRKLVKLNKPSARGLATDFLSDDFKERDFDVVYAYAVLHHFENLDVLFNRLKEIMKPGGIIISYDPLETSRPIKIIRAIYRPFQSDADWEWPFTTKTLKRISDNFTPVEVHGVLGRSKYGIFFDLLPISNNFKKRKIQQWIDRDWKSTDIYDVTPCMHVTMLLRNNG